MKVCERPVSDTLGALIEQFNQVRAATAETERMVREANDGEAEAADVFRRAFAKAYVTSSGPTELRRQLAILETADAHARLDMATGLRRSATEAARLREKELETIAAAFHFSNRELKLEQQLMGTGTGGGA